MSSVPGPRRHWLLGNLAEIRRGMPGVLRDVARAHGGVSRIRVGPAATNIADGGQLIVDLLTRSASELRKSSRTRWRLGGHAGDGPATLAGVEHRRHRRLVQPVMHTSGIAAQADTTSSLTESRVGSWTGGSTVDAIAEMQDLTSHIVGAALLHVDTQHETDRLVAAVPAFPASLNVVLR